MNDAVEPVALVDAADAEPPIPPGRRQAWRDAWVGTLVFGLLGPLFGGAPIIVPYAVGGAIGEAAGGNALWAVPTLFGVFFACWGFGIAFAGLPCALTGALSAFYRRRVDPARRVLYSVAIGAVSCVVFPLLMRAVFAAVAPDGRGDDFMRHGLGVYAAIAWLPALWAIWICEGLMAGRRMTRQLRVDAPAAHAGDVVA